MNSPLANLDPQQIHTETPGREAAKRVVKYLSFHPEQNEQVDRTVENAENLDAQGPTNVKEVAAEASSRLATMAHDYATDAHSALTASTLEDYRPDDLSEIMSPNQYLKRSGLDTTYKPWLRQAYMTATEDSKKRLRVAARSVAIPASTDAHPTDEELEASAATHIDGIASELSDVVQVFEDASTSRPKLYELRSGNKARIDVENTRLLKEHCDKPTEQREEELRALAAINVALIKHLQHKNIAAERVTDTFFPAIRQAIEAELAAKFASLPAEEAVTLKQELEAAYIQAVREKEAHDAVQRQHAAATHA